MTGKSTQTYRPYEMRPVSLYKELPYESPLFSALYHSHSGIDVLFLQIDELFFLKSLNFFQIRVFSKSMNIFFQIHEPFF